MTAVLVVEVFTFATLMTAVFVVDVFTLALLIVAVLDVIDEVFEATEYFCHKLYCDK